MNTILLASYFALWAVVLLLVGAMAVFARQIGLLHKRLAPIGARTTNVGPEIGDHLEVRTVADIDDRQLVIGAESLRSTLLVFVSPRCSACAQVLADLPSLWKLERKRVDFVLIAVTGSEQENRRTISEYSLQGMPYIVSRELGLAYKVLSPPFGVLLDKAGVVKAKGLVNHVEHLHSLLNAADLDEPTLESYMHTQRVGLSTKAALS